MIWGSPGSPVDFCGFSLGSSTIDRADDRLIDRPVIILFVHSINPWSFQQNMSTMSGVLNNLNIQNSETYKDQSVSLWIEKKSRVKQKSVHWYSDGISAGILLDLHGFTTEKNLFCWRMAGWEIPELGFVKNDIRRKVFVGVPGQIWVHQ